MSCRRVFEKIKKLTKLSPKQQAERLNVPTGTETGARHPVNGTYVLLRDDNAVELGAGTGANILVDGAQQQASIRATAVSVEGEYLHLHAPPGGIYFGYRAFNPYWHSAFGISSAPGQVAGAVDPLGILTPKALTEVFPGTFDILASLPLLVGTPGVGQAPITLASYLKPEPLFGPDEQLVILSTNLMHLLKNLTVGIG